MNEFLTRSMNYAFSCRSPGLITVGMELSINSHVSDLVFSSN
jgi:hypothetical protein